MNFNNFRLQQLTNLNTLECFSFSKVHPSFILLKNECHKLTSWHFDNILQLSVNYMKLYSWQFHLSCLKVVSMFSSFNSIIFQAPNMLQFGNYHKDFCIKIESLLLLFPKLILVLDCQNLFEILLYWGHFSSLFI